MEADTGTLRVEWVDVDQVFLNPANPRHNDEAVPQVAASLRRFGWRQPIVVKSSGEVIAGNTRLKAAKALGMKRIPVTRFEGPDIEAVAYAIADNRTHEFAEWDEPALARILQELQAEDALDGVGFTDADLDELAAQLDALDVSVNEIEDPGVEEPPENPVTRPGDLWVLDHHRLLCGDSTKAEDVARLLDGREAALLSSDPPYCVNYTGNDRPIHDGKPSGKDWSHLYREVDIADLGQFMDAVFSACLPHVKPDAAIYIWHAHVQQPVIAAAFEKHDLLLHQVLVWVKPTATFGHGYYRWRHEPCAFGWKRGHKPTHGLGKLESVWEVDWEGKSRVVGNEHPCLHPESRVLTESGFRQIQTISEGDRVYTADGTFHRVAAVTSHPYTSDHLYRIVVRGGNEVTMASDNHPFLVWRPERRGQSIVSGECLWVTADQLRVGDYTMTPVLAHDGDDPFPGRSEDYWFLLGLFVAERQFKHVRPCYRLYFYNADTPRGRGTGPTSIEHNGHKFILRYVKAVEPVPYTGDVWNLSVCGNPTFQTAVGMSHNTQKPLRLFEIPMEQHTQLGQIVLEPFSGSGSQLLAAERLGRKCRAMEIQPAFVDVAIRRWEKATGKKAYHEGTNLDFEEVAKERESRKGGV